MTNIQVGDTVEKLGTRGKWLVVKIEGNRLTVTNPHTHGGRTYLPADKCQVVRDGGPQLIKSRRSCVGCGMRPGMLYGNGLCESCQNGDAR